MTHPTFRAVIGVLACLAGPAIAEEKPYFDPEGPFRSGEDIGPPVTCETIGDWIDRVPNYDGRISMAITGKLTESSWDGALAYLIMCEPEDIQVMCVTYYESPVDGTTLQMAGGYIRFNDRQVVLDPCLAVPEKQQ